MRKFLPQAIPDGNLLLDAAAFAANHQRRLWVGENAAEV